MDTFHQEQLDSHCIGCVLNLCTRPSIIENVASSVTFSTEHMTLNVTILMCVPNTFVRLAIRGQDGLLQQRTRGFTMRVRLR